MAKKHHIPNIERMLKRTHKIARDTARQEVQSFMEEELAAFKLRIERQDFASFRAVPLSETYRDWKMYKGLDGRTMIRTGHYIDKIDLKMKMVGDRMRFRIGYDDNARATDADGFPITLPLHVLAAIHEHGSINAGIPARPHWGPQLQVLRLHAYGRTTQIAKKIAKAVKGAA